MQFSSAVIFPADFYDKYQEDLKLKELGEQGQDTNTTRRLRRRFNIFKFDVEGAASQEMSEVPQENIEIIEISSKDIKMKIKYNNPE